MRVKHRRIMIAATLFLSLAAAHAYVSAQLSGRPAAAAQAGDPPAIGHIHINRGRYVVVNDNRVGSDSTVFSGSRIETPEDTCVEVRLRLVDERQQFGRLRISPQTRLTLDFDEQQVNVMLQQGCVALHTEPGITGVVTARGETFDTRDGGRAREVEVSLPEGTAKPRLGGCEEACDLGLVPLIPGGLLEVGAVIAGVLADAAPSTLPCRRPPDTSPSLPLGGADECR